MSEPPSKKTITLQDLEAMFDDIAGRTGWDLTQPMQWSYFFTHHQQAQLDACAEELVARGYRFVDVWESGKNNPNAFDSYLLHVERAEVHTPESLDRRNDELYQFAADHGLDSYDGMEVGPLMAAPALRFTGSWPPLDLLDRYPNWEHALDEEDSPGQDETTLRPAGEQAIVAQFVAYTAGRVKCADGTRLRALIEIGLLREPVRVVGFVREDDGWTVTRLGTPPVWTCNTWDWLPEEARPPMVSFDDTNVFPLDVAFDLPHEAGDEPQTFTISGP